MVVIRLAVENGGRLGKTLQDSLAGVTETPVPDGQRGGSYESARGSR
jgi:hypothetical protein